MAHIPLSKTSRSTDCPKSITSRTFRSKQRDPNPKDNSLIRKETSTYKGSHDTFAALLSYRVVV